MKPLLLTLALSISAAATPMWGTGNGSSAYVLTEVPHFEDGYFRSHFEQTIGGVDRDDTWFINVAITTDTVDREWVYEYRPTPQMPYNVPTYVQQPQQPTPTPEPWSMPMLAVILMAIVWFRS